MRTDDLVQRAQRGDRAAIEELFRREWPAVYHLVYRAVRDEAEAQDLTQEVFVRAFRSLDRYQPTGAPFRAYLQAIARNLVRERWRRSAPVSVSLEHVGEPVEPAPLEDQVFSGLIGDELMRVLASLPVDYQRVIQFRLLEGRPTAEVAALMNRSPGAVRVLQYRALALLRDRLREVTMP